jgi:hypothetical protein
MGGLLAARPGLASLLVDVTGERIPPGSLADPRRLLRALRAVSLASSGTGTPGAARTASPPAHPDDPAPSPNRRSRHAHA